MVVFFLLLSFFHSFSHFFFFLDSCNSSDADLVASALAVLNAILVGEKNLSERMSSRNLFTLKLAKTFEKLRSAFYFETALIKQLDVFDYMAEQDNVWNFYLLTFIIVGLAHYDRKN
jgi:hypothetical protein